MRGAKLGCQWHSKKDWCPPKIKKRMHSSKMRTARLLTVSQHTLPEGVPPRVCTYLGGVPARRVYLPGGYLPGGVPAQGGVYLPGGVHLPRGVCVPAWGCTCPGTPPVNRMTERCKNITLPQTSFAGGNKPSISTNKKNVTFLE